jgi:hypothetical protein
MKKKKKKKKSDKPQPQAAGSPNTGSQPNGSAAPASGTGPLMQRPITTARSTRSPTSNTFPVIVLDTREDTAISAVVQAESHWAAKHEAVVKCKAKHDLSADFPDEEARIKAVASYSRAQLADFLREMELPAPDV